MRVTTEEEAVEEVNFEISRILYFGTFQDPVTMVVLEKAEEEVEDIRLEVVDEIDFCYLFFF